MVGKSIKIDDLVWIKQPGQGYWPGIVEKPPKDLHSPSKNSHYFVKYFAMKKSGWVKNKEVVLHSEKMLQNQNTSKRKSASLKKAIEELINLNQKRMLEVLEMEKVNECAMPLNNKETREEQKNEDVLLNNSLFIDESNNDEEICDTNVCSSEIDSQMENNESMLVDNSYEGESEVIQPLCVEKESVDFPTSQADGLKHSDVVMTSIDTPDPVLNSSTSELCPKQTDNSESVEQSDVMLQVDADDRSQNSSTSEVCNIGLPRSFTAGATVQDKTNDQVYHKIGFLGLGRMGTAIVKELMLAGYDVTVWNRSAAKCKFPVLDGAHQGESPSDVVAKCDITFSCVSDSEASKLLVLGPQGVLHGLKGSKAGSKGYVELSSNDPSTSIEIGKAISDAGGLYLEAPVSLSKEPEKDKMMIIASGDRELFDKCVFYFRSISKTTYFISCEVGSASKLNAIIGSLHGVLCGLLAESLKLAEKCNVPPNTFLSFLDQVADLPTYFIERGKAMLDGHFSATTSLKHQHKLSSFALSLGADSQSLNQAANKVSLSLGAGKSSSPNVDEVNKVSASPNADNKSEYINLLISYCAQKIFNEAKEKFSDKDISAVYMSI